MYVFGNSEEVLKKRQENFKKHDSDYISYARCAAIMFFAPRCAAIMFFAPR